MLVAFKIVMFPKCGLLKTGVLMSVPHDSGHDSGLCKFSCPPRGWLGSWFDFPVVCLSTQQTSSCHKAPHPLGKHIRINIWARLLVSSSPHSLISVSRSPELQP